MNMTITDENLSRLMLFAIVSIVAIAPGLLAQIPFFVDRHEYRSLYGLLGGFLIALFSYPFLAKTLKNPGNGNTLSAAVLLGLIAAEDMAFGVRSGLPSVLTLCFVFMVFYYYNDHHSA
jgi:hypothetical protein